MSIDNDIETLQHRLAELARSPDDASLVRYIMKKPRRPDGFYWQLRWLAGRFLRWLQAAGVLHADPWPVALAHTEKARSVKPVLIWAVGAHRDRLREACRTIAGWLDDMPEFAPVLVTDVADFAFFSRLGWLVEYLPTLEGEGENYETRKIKVLARVYQEAPVLPISTGLVANPSVHEIRKWMSHRA